MAHGITETDLGYIWGDTWHGCPQYVVKQEPVTTDEALKVFAFDYEKVPTFYEIQGCRRSTGGFAILRSDTKDVIVSGVGKQFQAPSNKTLVEFIDKHVLREIPELKIEGVGTLFGGKIAWINLATEVGHISGDFSDQTCRIMTYNPVGLGSYKVCAHSVRVVCNNTLRAAESYCKQSVRIPHTINANTRITKCVEDFATMVLGLKKHIEVQQQLSEIPVLGIDQFLADLYPLNEDATPRMVNSVGRSRNRIREHWETRDDSMSLSTQQSYYGLLQSVTNVMDHDNYRSSSDQFAIAWDGIDGRRASIKDNARDLLLVDASGDRVYSS